jgi:hypothetical protein
MGSAAHNNACLPHVVEECIDNGFHEAAGLEQILDMQHHTDDWLLLGRRADRTVSLDHHDPPHSNMLSMPEASSSIGFWMIMLQCDELIGHVSKGISWGTSLEQA